MKTIILKIGGSIATDKSKAVATVRKDVLSRIAREIRSVLDEENLQLVFVHGAGQHGHAIAKEYDLKTGVGKDPTKMRGALQCQQAIRELHSTFCKIFLGQGISLVSVNTEATILQKDGKIIQLHESVLHQALKTAMIPVLYGQMVCDTTQTMSVCSGDDIAVYLAHILQAEKIIFASDIDGIFTADPYDHPDAKLIREINIRDIFEKDDIALSESHNMDVTGGLRGKVTAFRDAFEENGYLKEIVLCNGLEAGNIRHVLAGDLEKCTTIRKGTE